MDAIGIVVFIICFTGMLCTWLFIMITFPLTVKSSNWLPLTAGIAITSLELGWTVGIFWDMDPTRFPKAFCIAQPLMISYGAYQIASVFATMTITVYLNLLQPRETRHLNPVRVRPALLPILWGFPVTGLIVLAVYGTKHDVFVPSWHICDAIDPPIVRLLTYAGWDWLVMAPTIVLCIICLFRLERLKRQVREVGSSKRSSSSGNGTSANLSSSAGTPTLQQSQLHTPSTATKTPTRPQFGFPPTPSSPSAVNMGAGLGMGPDYMEMEKRQDETTTAAEIASLNGSTFPLMEQTRRPQGITQRILEIEGVDSIVWGGKVWSASPRLQEARASRVPAPDSEAQEGSHAALAADVEREWITALNSVSIRVSVLLVAAAVTQILACVSPFLAIAQNRVDRSFGSQHLAGFCAGWAAPVVLVNVPDAKRTFTRIYRKLWRQPPGND